MTYHSHQDDFFPHPAALPQAPCILTLVDRDRRVLWASRYAYGHRAEDVLGVDTLEFICPADREFWATTLQQVLDLGETRSGRVRCQNPAGPDLVMHFRVGPVWSPASPGKAVGAMVVSWEDASPNPLRRFVLSPRAALVVAFLAGGAASGKAIGAHLRELSAGRPSTTLRELLTELCDRGVLAHGRDGYRLTAEFKEAWGGP